ncbi:MAG TPA: hypothetical protein VIY30_12900, partial [Burkholderiaceae bacterium]
MLAFGRATATGQLRYAIAQCEPCQHLQTCVVGQMQIVDRTHSDAARARGHEKALDRPFEHQRVGWRFRGRAELGADARELGALIFAGWRHAAPAHSAEQTSEHSERQLRVAGPSLHRHH